MNHRSRRLDRRFHTDSEEITEHTLEDDDLPKRYKWFDYVQLRKSSPHAFWIPFMNLGAVQSVTFPTAVTPLCDLPHSPKRIRLQSSTGEIQADKSPLPSAVRGYRYTCLRQIQTHTYGRIHARTREVACECTITVSISLLLFQNISCFHAATYASWMFASDIQINGAAKCATSVLLRPTLGGCTTLFSATSSQPSPGRQLRDKTIHCY